MFSQGDKEVQLGMPVSPLMSRSTDSLACGQEFFFTKFVMPLLVPYIHFLTPELGQELTDTLESNAEEWRDRIERHGKKKAVELVAIEP